MTTPTRRDAKGQQRDILERLTLLERRQGRVDRGPRAWTEWAAKGGPLVHVGDVDGAYCTTFQKGVDSGDSIDGTTDDRRILITEDGIYEVVARQRGSGNPANGYIGIGLSGSRPALADRAEGMWDHDHSLGVSEFSTSHYIGPLYAGEKVTMGAEAGQGNMMQYGPATHLGTLTVRRIS